jgi:hypothetical protein
LHEIAHLSRREPLVVILQEVARPRYRPIVPVHALIRDLIMAKMRFPGLDT